MDLHKATQKIRNYAHFYRIGAMDKKMAELLASPYIKLLNEKGKEVAKKHSTNHRTISFGDFI